MKLKVNKLMRSITAIKPNAKVFQNLEAELEKVYNL